MIEKFVFRKKVAVVYFQTENHSNYFDVNRFVEKLNGSRKKVRIFVMSGFPRPQQSSSGTEMRQYYDVHCSSCWRLPCDLFITCLQGNSPCLYPEGSVRVYFQHALALSYYNTPSDAFIFVDAVLCPLKSMKEDLEQWYSPAPVAIRHPYRFGPMAAAKSTGEKRLELIIAPTWVQYLNEGYSLYPHLRRIIEDCRKLARVVISPHPASLQSGASENEPLRLLAQEYASCPDVFFDFEKSTQISIGQFAILITDTSGIMFSAIVDKNLPVIVVDPVGRERSNAEQKILEHGAGEFAAPECVGQTVTRIKNAHGNYKQGVEAFRAGEFCSSWDDSELMSYLSSKLGW